MKSINKRREEVDIGKKTPMYSQTLGNENYVNIDHVAIFIFQFGRMNIIYSLRMIV